MKTLAAFLVLCMAAMLGCSGQDAQDQALIHYYVELDQVGLTRADSIVLDYGVEGRMGVNSQVQADVSKAAVFDILVDEGALVSVRVRVYDGGKVVSTRLDQFRGGERGFPTDLKLTHVPLSFAASIGDTIDFFSPYEGLGLKSCAYSGSGVPIELGNCKLYFPAVGEDRLQLKMLDEIGNPIMQEVLVRVVQGMPTVSLGVNKADVGIGDTVILSAVGDDLNEDAEDGAIVSYEWDFDGDGSYDKATRETEVHFVYPDSFASHVYAAQVRVTDDDGNTATAAVDVAVANRAPTLKDGAILQKKNFILSEPGILSLDAAKYSDLDGNGNLQVTWSFGDGEASKVRGLKDTIHLVRATPQKLTVTLTVMDKYGLTASQDLQVEVRDGMLDPRDGETYAVVTYAYGGAEHSWMADNLNYSGHKGANLYDEGKTYTTGWCYGMNYHYETRTCFVEYGRFYTWADAMALDTTYLASCFVPGQNGYCGTPMAIHQGICPEGWHVPSDAEWTALIGFVEAQDYVSGNAGAWLKAVVPGNDSWNNAGYNQQDPLGFAVLPLSGINAYFWSASEYNDTTSLNRYLAYNKAAMERRYDMKSGRKSLRCVKD